MIKEADLILVMEEFQRDEVLRLVPEASAKTHLLREFGRENKPYYSAVPDPIGRPLKDYEECLKTIKEETERIARLL
jgi:protein-tyrosine-phosphatase